MLSYWAVASMPFSSATRTDELCMLLRSATALANCSRVVSEVSQPLCSTSDGKVDGPSLELLGLQAHTSFLKLLTTEWT